MAKNKTEKRESNGEPYRSAPGEILWYRHNRYTERFDLRLGLRLTDDRLDEIEDAAYQVFMARYPDCRHPFQLPLTRYGDGFGHLSAKALIKPDVLPPQGHFGPYLVRRGDRVRVNGILRPYEVNGRSGVVAYFSRVEVYPPQAETLFRVEGALEAVD